METTEEQYKQDHHIYLEHQKHTHIKNTNNSAF
jgi:hypothetical protein